ncbi:MAG: O-antigen ligase family protein [Prevotellaceae bacterium]|jgi:hypothetical protein|nr:O-antigen ligase family protein [Prevotellaceae bacterium]
MKRLGFLRITLIFSALSFIAVCALTLFGFAKIENERVMRFVSIAVFGIFALGIALNEANFHTKAQSNRKERKNSSANSACKYLSSLRETTILLVTITFSALLLLSISTQNIGIYASGVFVGAAAFTLLCNGKIYKPAWCYYFLFFYAVFLMFGTIGTHKGFHFPEMTYSFYLLPISFTAFQFSEKTLLKIAHFFVRAIFIYLIISILYWWFNFQYLDVNFVDWATKKMHIPAHIADWTCQNKLSKDGLYPAFYFVSSWAYYFHPSYISLVLFCALISGIYLFFKSKINKIELIFFILFLIFLEILIQSRIGLIGTFFIIIFSFFYYFRKKMKNIKIILPVLLIITICIFWFFNKNMQNYLQDNTRKTDYTLAINYIENHFWRGCGYYQQTEALREQEEIMKETLPKVPNGKYYVHNQLLGNMLQFGVWGGIVLVILILGIIFYAIKKRSFPLLAFILTIILFMQIEEPLYGQTGITQFCLFLTYFVAISQSGEKIKFFDLYKRLFKCL